MWFDADSSPQFDNHDFRLSYLGFEPEMPFAPDDWFAYRDSEAGFGPARSNSTNRSDWQFDGHEEPVGEWSSPLLEIFPNPVQSANSKDISTTRYEDIVVIGYRNHYDLLYPWWGEGTILDGWSTGGAGGGGDASDGTPGNDLDHNETCGSEAGAADQIRDSILETDTDNSDRTPSYQGAEYGAFIVQNANGSFGASNSMIYTDGLESRVSLEDNLPDDPTTITGMIHNHTGFGSNNLSDVNFYAYPSLDDWQTASMLVSQYGVDASTLSLWVIDPMGTLREFQYSDMATYVALTEEQMRAGANMPETSTVEGCG